MQQLWGSKNPIEKFGFLCTPEILMLWLVENRKGPYPSLYCGREGDNQIHLHIVLSRDNAEAINSYVLQSVFQKHALKSKRSSTTFNSPYISSKGPFQKYLAQ